MLFVIVNADCFEYLKTIESNSVDLILTDPPYNISRSSNFDKVSDIQINYSEKKLVGVDIYIDLENINRSKILR